MPEVLKFCGIAVTSVAVILVVKQIRPEFAPLVTVTVSVIGLAVALSLFQPAVDYIKTIIDATMYGDYIGVLLKSLGIGLTAQTAADICKDSGETAVASKVEFIAKAEILLISLPLLQSIIALTGEILYQ